MNLKWLSLGKRCSRNWFFFFLLSVTYILCKKGPLGHKTHFKGITVKGKHALGQLLFYSLLLDMFFVSSKDLAIKKWENAMRRNCWKHITRNSRNSKKSLFWVIDPFSECNQRYSVFYLCATKRTIFFSGKKWAIL